MSLIPREGDASYVQTWINIDRHCPQDGQYCLVKCADGRRPKIIFTYDAEQQEFQHPDEDFAYPKSAIQGWMPIRIPA